MLRLRVDRNVAPAFADWDGDSDIDLIVGQLFGPLAFFERVANFSCVERMGRFSPFGILAPEPHSAPDGRVRASSFADHSLDVFRRDGMWGCRATLPHDG